MRKHLLFFSLYCCLLSLQAQEDIFALMGRKDLTLQEIERRAEVYFQQHGTGKGSGSNQYQRWLYERRFHTDEKGYFIEPETEDRAYHQAIRNMGVKNRGVFTWKEVGPKTWNHSSSWNPGVGRLTSVAVNPADENIIYVSSPGGGIWKTTDGAKTWVPLIDFVNSGWMDVYNLCMDPNNANTLYAALTGGGVLKSTNAGETWVTTGSGPSGSRQVKIFPDNSNLVFCAATNGLWRSVNGGATWKRVETSTSEDVEFNPANKAIMYASGNGGAFYVRRSIDTGKTWTGIDSAAGIFRSGRTLLAVSAANPARVYALQAAGSVMGRFSVSNDTGKTFQTTVVGDASKGTNYLGYSADGTDTKGQANHDLAICSNPLNADEVHIAGIICFKSVDAGNTFEATTVWTYPNWTGYNHADVHSLVWVNSNLYSTSDGGIFRSSDNGGDWEELSTGLGIRQFYRIACSPLEPRIILGGAQDNGTTFRRTDRVWYEWLGADGMDCVTSPNDPDLAIGTSQFGGLYKTENAGASFSNLTRPATGNWVTPLVMHPSNQDTIWGGYNGVYRSDDGGKSWNKVTPGINNNLNVLAVASSNTKYIYASRGNLLYRSANGGANFKTITAPATVTSIFVSKYNPMKIWITCDNSTNRVLTSNDGGDTFINLSQGLPTFAARSVVVDEDAHQTIYVGMNIGVYYRDTLTNKWAEHAVGLPLVSVNEVEIQKSGAKLRVATYGRGVWESDLRNVILPCAPPDVNYIMVDGVNHFSARVSWTPADDAVTYTTQYKRSADTGWITKSVSTSNTRDTFTGLKSNTAYVWRVRSNCNMNSGVYAEGSFNTLVNGVSGLKNAENAMRIYPQPAGNGLNVSFHLHNSGVALITMYDMAGNAVLGSRINAVAGENKLPLDVAVLPSGRYLLKVQTENTNLIGSCVLVK
jgi:photosystem II stability/assembly factor-like uncharacterized protein